MAKLCTFELENGADVHAETDIWGLNDPLASISMDDPSNAWLWELKSRKDDKNTTQKYAS